ncbi:hypothetical protein BDY21DRAFT_339089 [Lineolata rhizophorae]|uniref:Uncharacterized protein n=1 Tax=Lineolata rhizophorae TaxID=578093 RepID=A0A6A6P4W2_9PEZI|nr:hypothetical protein BDY21DRAFT_339089 [Lineolata rhizophorae]
MPKSQRIKKIAPLRIICGTLIRKFWVRPGLPSVFCRADKQQASVARRWTTSGTRKQLLRTRPGFKSATTLCGASYLRRRGVAGLSGPSTAPSSRTFSATRRNKNPGDFRFEAGFGLPGGTTAFEPSSDQPSDIDVGRRGRWAKCRRGAKRRWLNLFWWPGTSDKRYAAPPNSHLLLPSHFPPRATIPPASIPCSALFRSFKLTCALLPFAPVALSMRRAASPEQVDS